MVGELGELAARRSEYGREKYQVDNPERPGETVELFHYRNLVQDTKEELADAVVYPERLKVRAQASFQTNLGYLELLNRVGTFNGLVHQAFEELLEIEGLVRAEAPELLVDQEDKWGPFSRRLRTPE